MGDTTGVQELIDKLKNQGVAEGQRQADQMIQNAQSEASQIVAKAKSEADWLLADAHRKIEVERSSAHEAIKIAFRDSQLALRSEFKNIFAIHLKRLVAQDLQDKNFLKQLLLTIAGVKGAQASEADRLQVLLPAQVLEEGEKGVQFSKDGKKELQKLVLGITSEMLRKGVELKVTKDFTGGIRVRLINEEIEIDLSDEALSTLLLNYLLPRYREIVSGQEVE